MVRSTCADRGIAPATLRSTTRSLNAPIDRRSGGFRAAVALAALGRSLAARQGRRLEDLLAHDRGRLVRTPGLLLCGSGRVHGSLPQVAAVGVSTTVSRPRWHSESTKAAASRAGVAGPTAKGS